ncbi:diphthamide biosynthesis enzyme Dph2 [Methanosarcinales archaeon]|nr:MAG: diphthamide biosynthesis enzyme Dph2 [Methanosarcinales archaeon]RLG28323.1 MAG: diphthamide biosynthesis enzyme Dph2 [Methanosarcinales archaeon]
MFEFGGFVVGLERVFDVIRERGARAVGLQFPEGLMRYAIDISRLVGDLSGAEVFISGDSCFGACDMDLRLLEFVDVLFHFAHTPMGSVDPKVVFVEVSSKLSVVPVVKSAVSLFSGSVSRVGVVTTVQHLHTLGEVCWVLESSGLDPVVGVGDGCIAHPGQVIGCNFSTAAAECDEYLFVGSGRFHPIGVAIARRRRVVAADPYTGRAFVVDPEPIIRKRCGVVARALDTESFGIIVSSKPGQERLGLARELLGLVEEHGKRGVIMVMDVVKPDQFLGLGLDALVSTACPRIAVDDGESFGVPILTPVELEIVLGLREWEDFRLDEITCGR